MAQRTHWANPIEPQAGSTGVDQDTGFLKEPTCIGSGTPWRRLIAGKRVLVLRRQMALRTSLEVAGHHASHGDDHVVTCDGHGSK